MQNTQSNQPSNAPIECKCNSGCIATLHIVITAHGAVVVSEADVCSASADRIGRVMALLPDLSWNATKLTTRAVPMEQTTPAVPDRPLPSLAHRVYVLKRLVEAFDECLGFHSGDVSMDRKVSFDADLAKLGARHKTMQVPLGASTFAGKILNAEVYIDKARVILHVFRFEDFAPWMRLLVEDEFQTLAPNLDQLDPAYQAGAFKFLRLAATEVAKRADEVKRGVCPPLKTAYFEFV